jgi:protein-disulfide isomerase
MENKDKNSVSVKLFIFGTLGLVLFVLGFVIIGGIIMMSGSGTQNGNNSTMVKTLKKSEMLDTEIVKEKDPNMFVTRASNQRQKVDYPTVSFINPQTGPTDAPVTIIEFANYNCPFCAEVESVIKDLISKYEGKINFVWKDLPVSHLQTSATLAAQGALCAGEQGKFWEYHDLLFANQQFFSLEKLMEFAGNLNLDVDNFTNCVESNKMLPRIEKSIQEADDLNISGTPHFYINKQEISGAAEQEDFERVIEIELNRQ